MHLSGYYVLYCIGFNSNALKYCTGRNALHCIGYGAYHRRGAVSVLAAIPVPTVPARFRLRSLVLRVMRAVILCDISLNPLCLPAT